MTTGADVAATEVLLVDELEVLLVDELELESSGTAAR